MYRAYSLRRRPWWREPQQETEALPSGSASTLYVVAGCRHDWVELLRVEDDASRMFVVKERDRLDELLGRTDLSRLDGAPVVLVESAGQPIGIAVSPSLAPNSIRPLIVFDMSGWWRLNKALRAASKRDESVDWRLLEIVESESPPR